MERSLLPRSVKLFFSNRCEVKTFFSLGSAPRAGAPRARQKGHRNRTFLARARAAHARASQTQHPKKVESSATRWAIVVIYCKFTVCILFDNLFQKDSDIVSDIFKIETFYFPFTKHRPSINPPFLPPGSHNGQPQREDQGGTTTGKVWKFFDA